MERTTHAGSRTVGPTPASGAISLPIAGEVPPEHLAWYAGLAAMAVLDLIDWPVALAIATGHAIAHRSHNKALAEFAQGIEAGG
jgi:hypothetical protein